jgi:hypothetical protein
MKIKADLIQGITKRINLRDVEEYSLKVSCKLGNCVRKTRDLKLDRRIDE